MSCSASAGSEATAARTGYTLDSSPSDLLGAHNDRVLVVFGVDIKFKRYFLVGLLSQCMTVATDISSIRYNVRETGRERTLVID